MNEKTIIRDSVDSEEIVKKVSTEINKDLKKLTKALILEKLGFKSNSWGEIECIEPLKYENELYIKSNVEKLKNKLKDKTDEMLEKSIESDTYFKKSINQMIHETMRIVKKDVEQELYKYIYDKLKNEYMENIQNIIANDQLICEISLKEIK